MRGARPLQVLQLLARELLLELLPPVLMRGLEVLGEDRGQKSTDTERERAVDSTHKQ